MAGMPIRGRFPMAAPPTKGVSMTVQYGKGWRVRCARMIFVVILPKTKDMVTQKRTRWFSSMSVEYGENTHAEVEQVKTIMGVHSRKTGRTGRLSLLRALTTCRTQNGTWAPKSAIVRVGTQRSITE